MGRRKGIAALLSFKCRQDWELVAQALKDMDTETLRRLLGNVNLPSWVNFPGD
jgi:hypothetical protein